MLQILPWPFSIISRMWHKMCQKMWEYDINNFTCLTSVVVAWPMYESEWIIDPAYAWYAYPLRTTALHPSHLSMAVRIIHPRTLTFTKQSSQTGASHLWFGVITGVGQNMIQCPGVNRPKSVHLMIRHPINIVALRRRADKQKELIRTLSGPLIFMVTPYSSSHPL